MRKLLLLLFVISSSCTFAEDSKLAQGIDRLIGKLDQDLNIGIKITNLDSGEVLVDKNANRYFIPGSSLKFISIVSLMDYFGEDFKFTSKVLNSGKDYYLDIRDPEFRKSDLDSLVKAMGEHANGEIKGDIYVVNNSFSVPAAMYNKTYGDGLYCNSGPVTKVHVNKNCSKLDAVPAGIGEKIKVKVPQHFPYKVQNNAVTVGADVFDRLYVSIKDDSYIIDGTLSKGTGKVVIGAVANDNFMQVKNYTAKSLAKYKIRLAGSVLYSKAKKDARPVASLSRSMVEVASTAMKKSDNFTTDYLLAMFATKNNYDKWEDAVQNLKEFIKKNFQVDLSKTNLYDASGISRMNLITINQMSNFLGVVARRPNFKIVKSIMACPGDECTLRERLKGKTGIYTKTGSLSNVSALIGYFYKNNQLHSFVIMANNFHGNYALYKKLEDDIVELAIGEV